MLSTVQLSLLRHQKLLFADIADLLLMETCTCRSALQLNSKIIYDIALYCNSFVEYMGGDGCVNSATSSTVLRCYQESTTLTLLSGSFISGTATLAESQQHF